MFSKVDATEAVRAILMQLYPDSLGDDAIEVMDSETISFESGWMFFYERKRALETNEMNDMLFGNAPLIFEKDTGRVFVTGTGEDPETYVARFCKTGSPFETPIEPSWIISNSCDIARSDGK